MYVYVYVVDDKYSNLDVPVGENFVRACVLSQGSGISGMAVSKVRGNNYVELTTTYSKVLVIITQRKSSPANACAFNLPNGECEYIFRVFTTMHASHLSLQHICLVSCF
jgi:hypothetical protein